MKSTAKDLVKTAIKTLDALSQHPELSDISNVESAINLILKVRGELSENAYKIPKEDQTLSKKSRC